MTPEICMTLADTLSPNNVPTFMKERWLSELEGHILVELRSHDPEALDFDGEKGETLTLSVPFPFDRLYWMYLVAMVDFWHGDITRYKESAELFDHAYESYAKWCKRERRA